MAHAWDAVQIHAPLRPGKVISVGLNYVEHVEESSRTLDTDKELPSRPVLFSKPGTAVVGPGQPIRHDGRLTKQLDRECELAVVIGTTARSVGAADAYSHVFGYTILNDTSARDQRRSGQWFFSKGQDSYAPMGPLVVTADELTDPHALDLSLFVNGDQKQDGNSKHMLFSIPQRLAVRARDRRDRDGHVGVRGAPNEFDHAFQPLHQVVIPHLGLFVGEMWDLDALAEDCAADGIHEFWLTAAPLPVTGAVGAPVNPIAVK